MTLVLFALSRYLLVLLLCTSAYFVGNAFLQRLTFTSLAERLSLCVAFGLGVLSHCVLLIGLFGWLTLPGVTFGIATATTVSILVSLKRRAPRKTTGPIRWPSKLQWIVGAALITGIGIVFVPLWLLPLYPATDFDATMCHLALAKAWLQAHAVIATPFLRGPALPHSAHTLLATLLLVKDDVAAQMLSLGATSLVAVGLYGWGKRVQGSSTGILAAALWLGSPVVLVYSGVASYHALAGLFAFAAAYTLATYAATGRLTWLFAAGAFVGFAQSTWSVTIYLVPIFAVASVYFGIRERRWQPIYVVALGVLLGWGPAVARAMWYTGNPTFPLLTEVFGTGPWWTTQDVAGMSNDIHRFGIPRTFLNLLLIPYALITQADKFQSIESFSVVLSACLPLVALRTAFDRYLRWLGAIVLFYVVCWFFFGQIMRYLLPIIPVVCVITARTIAWVLEWICRRQPLLARALVAITAAAALLPGPLFARKELHSRGPVPMTIEGRAAYIAAQIPQYPALAVANAAPGPVYSLLGTNCAYYSDGQFMGDFFGPGRYAQVFDSLGNGKTLYTTLHRLGAKYFLVTLDDLPILLPNDQDFDSHFELLYANAAAKLYLIHDSPRPILVNRTNLLRNAGFDELENAWPVAWNRYGNPIVGTPTLGAASGNIAVEVTGADGLAQSVRVTPGNIYELATQARADKPGNSFRLQVNWTDLKGKPCEVFIRVYEATANWEPYSSQMTAPSCAEIADVYASGQSPEKVWLDSFVFKQGEFTNP